MSERAAAFKKLALGGCALGLLYVACDGDRHVVTADIVPNPFATGTSAALCVGDTFVVARWIPRYEEVFRSQPTETVRVRPEDGSESVAGIGDRIEVVIERRTVSGGGGGPSTVAQVVEIRDVVVGGAADVECDDFSSSHDEWWSRLP